MRLTTHVLDTATGIPGGGITVILYAVEGSSRTELIRTMTDADGRTPVPLGESLADGWYEIVFELGEYFSARGAHAFYGDIAIRVRIEQGPRNYHVPLLVSPWGYSTYRGS